MRSNPEKENEKRQTEETKYIRKKRCKAKRKSYSPEKRVLGFVLACLLVLTSIWNPIAVSANAGGGAGGTKPVSGSSELSEAESNSESETEPGSSELSEAESNSGSETEPGNGEPSATEPKSESETEPGSGEPSATEPKSGSETEPGSGEPSENTNQPNGGEPSGTPEPPVTETPTPEPPEEEEPVSVTIDLDGGKINGLAGEGWEAAENNSYVFTKKAAKGSELTISSPYRFGYVFKGWTIDSTASSGADGGQDSAPSPIPADEQKEPEILESNEAYLKIAVYTDCRLQAAWEEELYKAEFYQGTDEQPLWTVKVAYGSQLWTMASNTPWEDDSLEWTETELDLRLAETVEKMETAEVLLTAGETSVETEGTKVLVTRYTQRTSASDPATDTSANVPTNTQTASLYYTFAWNGTTYFTYGGPEPTQEGHYFAGWQAIGEDGYAVTGNGKMFLAQYTMQKSYLFHVYYYQQNGTKAGEPTTIMIPENKVTDGKIETDWVTVPSIRFYEPELTDTKLPEGVRVEQQETDGKLQVRLLADIEQAFADASQANPSISVIVYYTPAPIEYKVVYHLQKEGTGTDPAADYIEIGFLTGKAKMGETVTLLDRPETLYKLDESGSKAETATDFQGFEANADAQDMIRRGKRLEESLLVGDTAVIHLYYNRSYYYVYTLTDSNESDPFDPERVQYGAPLPEDKDGSKLVKTGYKFQEWKWYQAGTDGSLALLGTGDKPAKMPAQDVYAVAVWKKHETKMQVVYWIEDANSGSFQNTYQMEVSGVPTGDRLVIRPDDKGGYTLTMESDESISFPAFTETFQEAICSKYGEKNDSYTQYFSFDPVTTFREEQAHNHAEVMENDGKLHYEVKADGTTTINLYYTRNLYTLQFVIQNNRGKTAGNFGKIASATNGTMAKATWVNLGTADTVFLDFSSDRITKIETPDPSFGNGSVTVKGEYRLKDAVKRNDTRAAVGRYAEVTITENNIEYPCYVYYLTARFEADIAELWPTLDNIKVQEALYGTPFKYISMGSNANSAYWKSRVDQNIGNKNILNRYSTMDALIVNDKSGIGVPDNEGNAAVTHRMYAYWANQKVKKYTYYFLYEVLDTTLNPAYYEEFKSNMIYADGTIVKWRAKTSDEYRLYVYRENGLEQNSTNNIENQNQPARHGYKSMGRVYRSIGNAGNVYYFYQREILTLSIYNVNGNWVPTMAASAETDLLHIKLPLTYIDELTGQETTGEKSLAQLGWEEVVDNADTGDKLIHLRYGARLGVLEQKSVTEAFQNKEYTAKPLAYPYKSLGINQYYFYGWYKDQENIVAVDWNANAMQNMIQDEVFYTGWTTPKYRIIFALNGGTWTDKLHMNFMIPKVGEEQLVMYYPHKVDDPENAKVFWYVPEIKKDFLYVKGAYISTVAQLMERTAGDEGHYRLKKDLTLDQMKELSDYNQSMEIRFGMTVYLCNLGEEGADEENTSHENYVNQHIIAGGLLPEPKAPVRDGYDFLGWYAFDEPDEGEVFTQKVWLDTVIGANEGLNSYKAESVYIDAAGEAHLLQEEQGRLFYYKEQNGYQYRFEYGASISSQDRTLYAAWKGQLVNKSKVLYLVAEDELVEGQTTDTWKKITINDRVYYEIMPAETVEDIESGSAMTEQAKPLTKEYLSDGRVWLPEKAAIRLEAGAQTPQGTQEGDTYRYEGTEPVFRIPIEDAATEAYTYYVYFLYHPVDKPSYTVYLIDLAQAVQSGVLKDYEDRFSRYTPPSTVESYVLGEPQTYLLEGSDSEGGVVHVNAPLLDGYTIYENWMETLQLEQEAKGNNIYFYYVNPVNDIGIRIIYHFMENGGYNNRNIVSVNGYPAQTGQRLQISRLTEGYETILQAAMQASGCKDSANATEKALYERYKGMQIESRADGITGTFAVGAEAAGAISADKLLDMEQAKALAKNYLLDRWSPTTAQDDPTIILSESTVVHVYLKDASLKLHKKDPAGNSLMDATFTVCRFQKLAEGETAAKGVETTVYEGEIYRKDDTFAPRTATTDQSGTVVFYDLSANVEAGYLYQITEEQAPKGQIPLAEPVYAKVPYQITEADGTLTTYYSVTYDIVNPGITYLPKAGGGGSFLPLFAGGGILTAGLLAAETLYGRKKTKRRKTR